jgi:hypothetical protein
MWGSVDIAPFILNLGARRRRLVGLTPRPLYLWNQLSRMLGGLQGLNGHFGEEKDIFHLPDIEP